MLTTTSFCPSIADSDVVAIRTKTLILDTPIGRARLLAKDVDGPLRNAGRMTSVRAPLFSEHCGTFPSVGVEVVAAYSNGRTVGDWKQRSKRVVWGSITCQARRVLIVQNNGVTVRK